jgi:hypothetical protein
MWINQNAWFSKGNFDRDAELTYTIKHPGNGAYIFMIDGEARIDGEILGRRDAMGVFNTDSFTIQVSRDSEILVIDVPME